MISVLNIILGTRTSGNRRLSTAQLELLLCLSRQQVDIAMEQTWAPVAGPLEPNIARFVSEGLLEEVTLDQKIDARYKVADIRQMLADRGITTKGRKHELIETLICSMTRAQAEQLVQDVRMFRLTEEGQSKVEAYLASREQSRREMELDATALLLKGDVKKAWARIARYYEGQLTADKKWALPVPGIVLNEATHLLKMPYDDLPLDGGRRRELGAQLALSVLLGEPFEDAGKRLISYVGEAFNWTQALAFNRPSPCGGNDRQSSQEAMAELYAMTCIHEALMACELSSLKISKLGRGIQVLPIHGNDCQVCHSGKFTYGWSELKQLPKLPRQIGCHCKYVAWL